MARTSGRGDQPVRAIKYSIQLSVDACTFLTLHPITAAGVSIKSFYHFRNVSLSFFSVPISVFGRQSLFGRGVMSKHPYNMSHSLLIHLIICTRRILIYLLVPHFPINHCGSDTIASNVSTRFQLSSQVFIVHDTLFSFLSWSFYRCSMRKLIPVVPLPIIVIMLVNIVSNVSPPTIDFLWSDTVICT